MINAKDEELNQTWIEYWEEQGPSLVWKSWSETYKEFISPEFLNKSSEEVKFLTEEVDETSSCGSSSEAAWLEVWEEHKKKQYQFYFDWFSAWWCQTHEQESEDLASYPTSKEQDCEESVLKIQQLSLDVKAEMEKSVDVKEQKNKTNLEKTKEFLSELGFSTMINQSTTCITESCKQSISTARKKRKKKLKVNKNCTDNVNLIYNNLFAVVYQGF